MKIFSKKLLPAWKSKSALRVWRLLPANGVLAVELRDPESKKVAFAGIKIDSGRIIWSTENDNDYFGNQDTWWMTINTFHKDVLLLQQFVKPDMPTAGKIFAIDLHNGSLLWQNGELSFLYAKDNSIYGLKRTMTAEEVTAIDLRTGFVTGVLDSSQMDDPDAPDVAALPGTVLPEPVELPAAEGRYPLKGAVKQIPADAVSPTLIPISAGKSIAGFYTTSGHDEKGSLLYDSSLFIVDGDGTRLYADNPERNVHVPIPDFYFTVDRTLLYVRNSNEIVAVRLD